jgi:hypothetical protein
MSLVPAQRASQKSNYLAQAAQEYCQTAMTFAGVELSASHHQTMMFQRVALSSQINRQAAASVAPVDSVVSFRRDQFL